MFTVCPKCALTLVVTAADLRVAQGYVRCGRCLNVFNALARLSEERPAAVPEPAPETAGPPLPEQAPAPPESSAQSATVDDTGEIEVELDASILVTAARPPVTEERPAEPEAQSLAKDPTAIAPHASQMGPAATMTEAQTPWPGPAAPVTEAQAPSPALAAPVTEAQAPSPAPAAPVTEAQTPSPAPAVMVSPERADSSAPAAAPDAEQTNTEEQPPERAFELESARPRAGLAWKIGAGALALALVLQIVNHYRDALASYPTLGGPLSTVYSALGVKLAPRWNVHAYDVRQLGASAAGAAAGEIVVRASVKNSAGRAQPLPLLRVTLQDRFGNRIAARDVPPGEYLPSSVTPSSLLAAGSRVDATMVFVDPGPQAVGFEIDACLRERSGEVACAHGP